MARTRFTGSAEIGRVSLRTIAATIAANVRKELSKDHFTPQLRFKNHLTIRPPIVLTFDHTGPTLTLGILITEGLLSIYAGAQNAASPLQKRRLVGALCAQGAKLRARRQLPRRTASLTAATAMIADTRRLVMRGPHV
jgi:hypothetical protein